MNIFSHLIVLAYFCYFFGPFYLLRTDIYMSFALRLSVKEGLYLFPQDMAYIRAADMRLNDIFLNWQCFIRSEIFRQVCCRVIYITLFRADMIYSIVSILIFARRIQSY